jgi:hypothetical protein
VIFIKRRLVPRFSCALSPITTRRRGFGPALVIVTFINAAIRFFFLPCVFRLQPLLWQGQLQVAGRGRFD